MISNHQTEADPAIISLLLEKTNPYIAENMVGLFLFSSAKILREFVSASTTSVFFYLADLCGRG